MRSTNNYPVFQSRRDELEIRPFRYRSKVGQAKYRFEDWKFRRFDQKYAAMVAQKREPNFYAARRFMQGLGSPVIDAALQEGKEPAG